MSFLRWADRCLGIVNWIGLGMIPLGANVYTDFMIVSL
jgi:hypothetical protein